MMITKIVGIPSLLGQAVRRRTRNAKIDGSIPSGGIEQHFVVRKFTLLLLFSRKGRIFLWHNHIQIVCISQ